MSKITCAAVPPNVKNIAGQIFGRYEVIGFVEIKPGYGAMWLCRCSCPRKTEAVVRSNSLVSGHTKSCGCLYQDTRESSAQTHGGCYDLEYSSWHAMMNRCYNENHESYAAYGGAGITVHPRWHDYANFKKDVPPRPSLAYSLDRIDGTKPYQPGNVRWATRKEQQRNMKSNVFLTYQGQTRCMQEWTEIKGWHRSKIKNRKYAGWSDERILSTP